MRLTRLQVARRIGRSISTVRKMEGYSLHPRVDWRGVHRFDADEVEGVAQEIAQTGRALGLGHQEWTTVTCETRHTDQSPRSTTASLSPTEANDWKERVKFAYSALLDTLPILDDEVMTAVEGLNEALESG